MAYLRGCNPSDMISYCVNNRAQASGEHEVHQDECRFLPRIRTSLGRHSSPESAVNKAISIFSKAYGCKFCCFDSIQFEHGKIPQTAQGPDAAQGQPAFSNSLNPGRIVEEITKRIKSLSDVQSNNLLDNSSWNVAESTSEAPQNNALIEQWVEQYISNRIGLKSCLNADEIHHAGRLNLRSRTHKDPIATTVEEVESFVIVKTILQQVIKPERVSCSGAQSYFAILLDDNNRKTICRLYFGKRKYIGTISDRKVETRREIQNIDAIFKIAPVLVDTVRAYDNAIKR